MKTEEINPGDILYDEERKMLVKVARVDEDGVVKYSAYTDMRRIFKTPPPPYRVGTRTADHYVPATDEQRKYMERNLAVCEYVNMPKDNRMETLAYIIADLKAENIEMTQRVHQLTDDYNKVVHQLNGKEKCEEESPAKLILGEMQQLRDHCDKLELENVQKNKFVKAIRSLVTGKNLYMKKAMNCPYYQDYPNVCSTFCLECESCLDVIEGIGVVCEKRLAGANVTFPDDD